MTSEKTDGHRPWPVAMDAVLSRYGLDGASVRPLAGGTINQNFRVDSVRGTYALKWYAPVPGRRWYESQERSSVRDRAERACSVQEAAREAGSPTPTVLPDMDGNLVAETEDGPFVLTEFVFGRQYARGQVPRHAAFAMGVTLARVLDVLGTMPCADEWRLPTPEEAISQLERLRSLASNRGRQDRVDDIARQMLTYRIEALGRWSRPVPPATEANRPRRLPGLKRYLRRWRCHLGGHRLRQRRAGQPPLRGDESVLLQLSSRRSGGARVLLRIRQRVANDRGGGTRGMPSSGRTSTSFDSGPSASGTRHRTSTSNVGTSFSLLPTAGGRRTSRPSANSLPP